MDLGSIFYNVAYYGATVGVPVVALYQTLFTIGQQQEGLVSRFGKYTGSTRKTGLNVKIPFIDKVDARVSTALQKLDAPLSTKTKDDQFVKLPISMHIEVQNTAKFYYDTTKPWDQISDLVSAEVRKYANEKDFNELYSDREQISEAVKASVAEEMKDYGVVLRRVVIDEPQPDENTKEAYNDVRASERRKDAAKNNAEAERIMSVAQAQADKERNELMGQGIASFRRSIANSYIETRKALVDAGIDPIAADNFMSEMMRMDTLRDVGQQGNMVIMALENPGSDSSVMPQVMAAMEAVNKKAPEQNNGKSTPVVAAKKSSAPAPKPGQ